MQNYFPEPYKPYDNQIHVLEEIEKEIQKGTKYIIVQAPTGTGKSMLAGTIANYSRPPSKKIIDYIDNNQFFVRDQFGNYLHEEELYNEQSYGTHVLTVSKQLQSQYSGLFEQCDLLKGRVNYICDVDDSFTCEISPCHTSSATMLRCIKEKICPFLNARDDVLKSKFSVLNYSMFFCFPDHAKKRQFIICDEASELEDEIVSHHSVTINYSELSKFFNLKIDKLLVEDRHKGRLWLLDVLRKLQVKISELQKIQNSKSPHIDKKRYLDLLKLKKLTRLNDTITTILDNWENAEYVIERVNDGVNFTPLYVNNLTKCIFNHADHVVLMSATIIDHKTFAKTLGIKDYKYIEVESFFDPNKSPIYCPGKYMLNYASINTNLKKVAAQALEICKHHENEKGIIHTHSFKITEAIQQLATKDKRFLFREPGVNNEKILEDHFMNDTNSVIVSPSLGYGTDLIGEHGKFQIIMKLPYLPLSSKRIKLLAKTDYNWYNMKMLISLIQMAGRCTRSKEDEAVTYILDGSAVNIIKKNWNKIPKYFAGRLK